MPALKVCRACEGRPSPAWSLRPCKRCGGSGLERKQPRYLAWLHGIPCVRCAATGSPGNPIEAHHERSNSSGAYGQKESDIQAVPLCRDCHDRRTRRDGRAAFWGHGEDLSAWLAALFAVLRACYEDGHRAAIVPGPNGYARVLIAEDGQARAGCDLDLHALVDRQIGR